MPDDYEPAHSDPEPAAVPAPAPDESTAPEPNFSSPGPPAPSPTGFDQTRPAGQHGLPADQVSTLADQPSAIEGGPAGVSTVHDAESATGPPWPRLVATDGAYVPPRLARWPIVVGLVVLASYTLAVVGSYGGMRSRLPSTAAPRVFTASDAQFTATFPGTPQRTAQSGGTSYSSQLSDHEVSVGYIPLSSSNAFSLDGAMTGFATAQNGIKLLSRSSLTYHGQPAEDGVISLTDAVGKVRVVAFGASAYIFTGIGITVASFRDDYNRLLDTFISTSPVTESTPAPSGTTRRPASRSLASKVIPAPPGFAADPTVTPPNGPITAAAFDSSVGKGAAAALQYVTGYQIAYTKPQGIELIAVTLYRFASPAGARVLLRSESSDTTSGTDRAIPGSVTFDAKAADSNGAYYHMEAARRGSTVLYVEYDNGNKARPTAALRAMTRQEYAKLR